MGSGKTHWGKIWSANFGYHFVDLDDTIEKIEGKTIADIFESKGEAYFRQLEAAVLRNIELSQKTIISCGGGSPCFYDNMKWMNENGTTIYLSSTPHQILERVLSETEKRPLIKKMNSAELLFFIEKTLKERSVFYNAALFSVQAHQLSENSFNDILLQLKSSS